MQVSTTSIEARLGNNGILFNIAGNNGILFNIAGNNGILFNIAGNNGVPCNIAGNNGIPFNIADNNGILFNIADNNVIVKIAAITWVTAAASDGGSAATISPSPGRQQPVRRRERGSAVGPLRSARSTMPRPSRCDRCGPSSATCTRSSSSRRTAKARPPRRRR
jgi:hypothetical protein